MSRHRRGHVATALALQLALASLVAGTGEIRGAVTEPYRSDGRNQVAPGVTHDWGTIHTDTSGRQAVHLVEVDATSPAITFQAALSNDTAIERERTTSVALRHSRDGHRAVAAINGDLCSWQLGPIGDSPHGIHIQGGELMTTNLMARPTFGIAPDGRPMIATTFVTVVATTATGATRQVTRINKERGEGHLTLYTRRFGPATGTDATGTEVVLTGVALPLRPTGTYAGTVARVATGAGNTAIRPDDLVLSGHGAGAAFLDVLVPGESISIAISITPGWEDVKEAVGGREYVVRNGEVDVYPFQSGFSDVTHPRSSIGVTADGRVVMATVDGRQPGYSTGVKEDELGQLMVSRGAVVAMALDGGGSTTMAVRRPGDVEVGQVNRGSDGSERAVASSLLVISAIPTGPMTNLLVAPPSAPVYVGTQHQLRAKGHDVAYNGVPVPPSQVTWSATGGAGGVDASGRFRAAAPGTATVTASYGALSASREIQVLPDTTLPTGKRPVESLVVDTTMGTTTLPVRLAWSSADRESGVASHQLQVSVNGAAWASSSLSTPAATTSTRSVSPSTSYAYRVRAVDRAGNVGSWAASPTFRTLAYQEDSRSITFTGAWTRASSSTAYGGRTSYATQAGSIARLRFTGSQVAWIASRGPTRGRADVYVDGVRVTRVDLYAASTTARRLVFTRAWPSSGSHVLEIRVVATTGRSRVDVDGFVALATTTASPAPSPSASPSRSSAPSGTAGAAVPSPSR